MPVSESYACSFDNGYSGKLPDKKIRGQQTGSFYNHIAINVCLALASCCRICYIKDRKGKAIEAATLEQIKLTHGVSRHYSQ